MTAPELSAAARSVWAKSDTQQATDAWLPLHIHMADSAEIATRLWDRWLPANVKRMITAEVDSERSARTLLTWLACCHDLGKATPAFAIQVPSLSTPMHDLGLRMPATLTERALLPHALASQFILQRWLTTSHDWEPSAALTYAIVPGSHHGVPPSGPMIDEARKRPELLGAESSWIAVQDELAEYAAATTGADVEFERWSTRPLTQPVQVLLTGIVILADWLASSTDHFELTTARNSAEAAERAWELLALPSSWLPQSFPIEQLPATFAARFGLAPTTQPRALQVAAAELAHRAAEPSLLIIEAPMGAGKTEASLLAVEIFADKFSAGGCFYALPTMATSDAMFPRVRSWISALPDARSDPVRQSMFLAYGKAQLNDGYRGLARIPKVNSMGDDVSSGGDTQAVVHEWLSGRKKGLLANFVVGTIDQLLFAALQAKHLALRHLALANKIVVVDEVHASDDYMRVYLTGALRWLGAYGVSAVLLSATLTPEVRTELVEAYVRPIRREVRSSILLRGRAKGSRARATEEKAPRRWPELLTEHAYPLLTLASKSGQLLFDRPTADTTSLEIAIDRMPDDDDSMVAQLRDALGSGGSVAVIRNTVGRAQHTASLLEAAFPHATVLLAHSRFIGVDRARIERELLALLGARGTDADDAVRFGDRPVILVGTQVLEQSIDIDVDLMISDLAPMDLLLQRMGRLHRHHRPNRAPGLRHPRFIITGVEDWGTTVPVPDRSATAVYGAYRTLRTLQRLGNRGTRLEAVTLPQDIAPLVRSAVGDDFVADGEWASALLAAKEEWDAELRDKRARATTFLLRSPDVGSSVLDWLARNPNDANDDAPEGQMQVRDTEESIEVLVIQKVGDQYQVLPWIANIGESQLPTLDVPPYPLALAVASCSIRLPPRLCKPWTIGNTIRRLEDDGFAAWQRSPLLKGQLIMVLDENLETDLGGIRVRYDQKRGLMEIKDA